MRLIRSGLIYTLANLATAGLPLLLLPILTRALDPAQYGQVVAFSLIVTVSGAMAGLNVHAALGVMWFQRETREMQDLVGSAVALALLSTACVVPATAFVVYLIPSATAGLHPAWGAFAAITAGANVLVQSLLGLWQAQEKPLRLATFQILSAALNLALSLVAVTLMGMGSAGRNLGFGVATLLAATAAVLILNLEGEMKWRVRSEHLADLTRFGAPLTLHILAAAILSTADRWVVSVRLDSQTLGIYGAGAQLGMVMAILGNAFVKAYSPWIYSRLKSDTSIDRLWVVGAIYAVIPLFLGVGIGVGGVLYLISGLLLGPEYASSASVLPWFMIGGAMNGVYLSISSLYFFSNRTGLLATVTTVSGIAGLIATIALTGTFGMEGAAMGYAAAQAILGLVSMTIAIRSFALPWNQVLLALQTVASRIGAALVEQVRKPKQTGLE